MFFFVYGEIFERYVVIRSKVEENLDRNPQAQGTWPDLSYL